MKVRVLIITALLTIGLLVVVIFTKPTQSDLQDLSVPIDLHPVMKQRYEVYLNLGKRCFNNTPRLRLVGTLQTATGEQQGNYIVRPTYIYISPKTEELYVSDTGDGNIKVFGVDDQLVSTIGRKGAGPGEFTNPSQLALYEDGSVWVVEMTRMQRFDSTLQPVTTLQIINWGGNIIGLDDCGFVKSKGRIEEDRKILTRFDVDGNPMSSFGTLHSVVGTYPDPRTAANYGDVLLQAHKDTIVTITSWLGTMNWYSINGDLLQDFQISHPFINGIRELNIESLRRSPNGVEASGQILYFLISGFCRSKHGGYWIVTNTAPFIVLFELSEKGQVISEYTWLPKEPETHITSFAIRENESKIRVYLSDALQGHILILEGILN